MSGIFHVDWYAKDWLIDTSVLSLEERGFFDVITNLIYARGEAITNDHKWISNAANCSPRKSTSLINALIKKGFIFINDDEKITQKRAEKELENARKRREKASKGGRKDGESKPKTSRKCAENEGELSKDKDLSSTSHQSPVTSHKEKDKKELSDPFDLFWEAYPKKTGIGKAKQTWQNVIGFHNADPEQMIKSAKAYSDSRRGEEEKYTKAPATFLSDQMYLDEELNVEPLPPIEPLELNQPWKKSLAELIGDTEYRNWFIGVDLGIEGGDITVKARNSFISSRMKTQYDQALTSVFKKHYPNFSSIEYRSAT